MTRRQLTHLSACALLLVLVLSVALPAVAAAYPAYPPMKPGHGPGSITGRVTNNHSAGIGGANVTLVNASDNSVIYADCRTDSSGYYGFSAVNSSTDTTGTYRVRANASGYSDGSSVPLVVEPGNTCSVITIILDGTGPTPTPTPTPKIGNISGYVTLADYGGAIPDVKVSVVDAIDAFTIYNSTYTDANGHYRINGVKAAGAPGYRLHVEKEGYIEAYSPPFLLEQNASLQKNQTIGKILVVTPAPTASATIKVTPTLAPSPSPSPSPSPQARSGLPSLPGFEFVTALACMATACAIARRQ